MISQTDIAGFWAHPPELNLEDYITLRYIFETSLDPRLIAAQLACEQSTVQWQRLKHQEDFRILHGAKVLRVEVLKMQGSLKLCEVIILYPHINFGARIPNLLTAIIGEGPFYCPGIQNIKLLDIDFPESYLHQFSGPQFGVAGLRKILNVYERPFFIGVVKPNLGMVPSEFAELAKEAWLGGLDIAKDDEMLADTAWSPLARRAYYCGQARMAAETATNKPKMMIMNITDEVDQLEALYYESFGSHCNAVMLNPFTTGISAIRKMRSISELPIMGHFAGVAPSSRMEYFGVSTVVYTKLLRISGCDFVVLSGFGERMHSPEREVLANISACLNPMGSIKPCLPVPGGSDWAGTLSKVYHKVGHVDFGFIAGRGIFSHPMGPQAGAASLQQAWEAIQDGKNLETYATENNKIELQGALRAFGNK